MERPIYRISFEVLKRFEIKNINKILNIFIFGILDCKSCCTVGVVS